MPCESDDKGCLRLSPCSTLHQRKLNKHSLRLRVWVHMRGSRENSCLGSHFEIGIHWSFLYAFAQFWYTKTCYKQPSSSTTTTITTTTKEMEWMNYSVQRFASDNVPLWWKKAALFIFGVTSVNRVLWHCDTICTHITCMYSMARMRIRMRHIVCIFILSASKEKRFWSGGSDTNTKRWWPIFFSTFILYKSIISTSTM